MKATEMLMEEHREIERVVDSLAAGARRLQSGRPARPGLFLEAADFAKNFTDACHHRKEEGVLFPALEAAGIPRDGGPIGAMLAEHDQGRRLTAAMREAAERLDAGDTAASAAVWQNALAYVELLRAHISKEDQVLFPMADQAISAEAKTELAEAFERVEREETGEGVHDKYLGVAYALEHEARSWEDG